MPVNRLKNNLQSLNRILHNGTLFNKREFLLFSLGFVMLVSPLFQWVSIYSHKGFTNIPTGLTGYQTAAGVISSILSMTSLFLIFKKSSLIILAAATNLIIGLGFLFGFFYTIPNASGYVVTVNAKFGLYVFLLASGALTLLSWLTKEGK